MEEKGQPVCGSYEEEVFSIWDLYNRDYGRCSMLWQARPSSTFNKSIMLFTLVFVM
jgi:hypothetical protein